jgi:hypothetical protein
MRKYTDQSLFRRFALNANRGRGDEFFRRYRRTQAQKNRETAQFIVRYVRRGLYKPAFRVGRVLIKQTGGV